MSVHHRLPNRGALLVAASLLSLPLLLAACGGDKGSDDGTSPTAGDDDDDAGDDDDDVPTGDTATDTDTDTTETGTTDTHTGTVTFVLGVELLTAPSDGLQAAEIGIDAPADAALTVSWSDGQGHEQSHSPAAGTATLPVLGMLPDRTYTVTVEATLDGHTERATVDFDSRPLPPRFPNIDLVTNTLADPFFTLLPLRANGSVPGVGELALVMDEAGNVVYWQAFDGRMRDTRRIDGGVQVFYGSDWPVIRDLTWLGETTGGFQSTDTSEGIDPLLASVDTRGRLHHDYFEAPDGTWFALTKEPVDKVVYPSDYSLQSTQVVTIAADVIEHFAADGTVLDRLNLADVLDPGRIGFDGLQLTNPENLFDWAHANSLSPHPDGDVLVSLRHQDAIVKLHPITGDIDWILGTPDNWGPAHQPYLLTPTGPLDWPFHTHAAEVRDDGVITLFDNGNYRDSPGPAATPLDDHDTWSRAVGFRVDAKAGTVEQVHDLQPTMRTFAYAVGDADNLANGHTRGHFGMVVAEGGQFNTERGIGQAAVRMLEWDAAGTEVWHAYLSTDAAQMSEGWFSYRSERFDSFYE